MALTSSLKHSSTLRVPWKLQVSIYLVSAHFNLQQLIIWLVLIYGAKRRLSSNHCWRAHCVGCQVILYGQPLWHCWPESIKVSSWLTHCHIWKPSATDSDDITIKPKKTSASIHTLSKGGEADSNDYDDNDGEENAVKMKGRVAKAASKGKAKKGGSSTNEVPARKGKARKEPHIAQEPVEAKTKEPEWESVNKQKINPHPVKKPLAGPVAPEADAQGAGEHKLSECVPPAPIDSTSRKTAPAVPTLTRHAPTPASVETCTDTVQLCRNTTWGLTPQALTPSDAREMPSHCPMPQYFTVPHLFLQE